jgi:hypothetical protein
VDVKILLKFALKCPKLSDISCALVRRLPHKREHLCDVCRTKLSMKRTDVHGLPFLLYVAQYP